MGIRKRRISSHDGIGRRKRCFLPSQPKLTGPSWRSAARISRYAAKRGLVTAGSIAYVHRRDASSSVPPPALSPTSPGRISARRTVFDRPGRAQSPLCAADCDRDGQVAISELVRVVSIALGAGAVETCSAADLDGNGRVQIDELLIAVNAALRGCPNLPSPTATVSSPPTSTRRRRRAARRAKRRRLLPPHRSAPRRA